MASCRTRHRWQWLMCRFRSLYHRYLDTHQDDAEAFAMYQSFLALKKEARERYVKQCGPVTHEDMLGMERYAWLDDPWPWDYDRQREG